MIEATTKISEIEVVCQRCKYAWTFRGLKLLNLELGYPVYAQCPNCRSSTKIIMNKKEGGKS